MSQRVERVAGEVRAILGEVLSRDEIKDPRVRGAGLITVTHVRVSGDLQHARALFTVHGLDEAGLERVREGLDHASGYFRRAIGQRLRMKVAPGGDVRGRSGVRASGAGGKDLGRGGGSRRGVGGLGTLDDRRAGGRRRPGGRGRRRR